MRNATLTVTLPPSFHWVCCEKAARGADLLAWSDTLKKLDRWKSSPQKEGFYSVGADPWWKEAVRRLAEDLVSGGDLPTGDQLERRLNAISRTMKSVASRCSERSIKALKTGPVEGEHRRLLDRLR